MNRSLGLIWLVVLAGIAQAAASPLLTVLHIGSSQAERSAPLTNPATPATWAFAIWGLIFLWTGIYAVWQALPARRADGILQETRGPALIAFAANAVWVAWSQIVGIDWVSLAIIVVALLANLTNVARLAKFGASALSRDGLLVKAPLGLLAGWVPVATFANAAAVHARYGLHPVDLTLAMQAAILIGAAGLLAAFMALRSRGNVFYALAAAWGLVAVIVRNQQPGGDQTTMWVAGAGIALVAVGLVAGWRKRKRQ